MAQFHHGASHGLMHNVITTLTPSWSLLPIPSPPTTSSGEYPSWSSITTPSSTSDPRAASSAPGSSACRPAGIAGRSAPVPGIGGLGPLRRPQGRPGTIRRSLARAGPGPVLLRPVDRAGRREVGGPGAPRPGGHSPVTPILDDRKGRGRASGCQECPTRKTRARGRRWGDGRVAGVGRRSRWPGEGPGRPVAPSRRAGRTDGASRRRGRQRTRRGATFDCLNLRR